MAKRPSPRTLTVLRKRPVSPNMLRITVGGPGLDGYPEDQDGAYLKLRLREPETEQGKPLLRTYTVRYYRQQERELDIDFVMHDVDGPAANWARNCNPGEEIVTMGPGPKKTSDPTANWHLIVGDMSALPAIGANLEALPRSAVGYALLEIIDEGDQQEIDAPQGIQVRWLVNRHPDRENTILMEAVKQIKWLEGTPYTWVAGEFSQSLGIRKWLKSERGMNRDHMYASSYWKIGQTEDGHKVAKKDAF